MKRKMLYMIFILFLVLCLGYLTARVSGGDLKESWIEPIITPGESRKPIPGEALLETNMPPLPAAYDRLQQGLAPAVKSQGDLGTCWAFASLTALESSLLPNEPYDFSEDHMSLQNSFHQGQQAGGDYVMSMAYLLAWQGPVMEEQDPYGDGISPGGLKPVKHVQEIQILPSKDYEKIKEAVYRYGGVQSSLFTSLKNYESRSVYYNQEESAYYYTGAKAPNHDVVILGWDDDYPKENFNTKPEGDGAFLCVSSWGEEFGQDGYFYVSYYDSNIGVDNLLYKRVDDTDNYGQIYQADLCGWIGQIGYGKESAYGANVYETGMSEVVQAVGFYATGQDTEYEVYVERHVGSQWEFSNREPVAKGKLQNKGFYTIDLDKPVALDEKERFGIVVKLTTPGAIHPLAVEYQTEDDRCQVTLSDGEGYISNQGTAWESLEESYGSNLCLKAYTTDRG